MGGQFDESPRRNLKQRQSHGRLFLSPLSPDWCLLDIASAFGDVLWDPKFWKNHPTFCRELKSTLHPDSVPAEACDDLAV